MFIFPVVLHIQVFPHIQGAKIILLFTFDVVPGPEGGGLWGLWYMVKIMLKWFDMQDNLLSSSMDFFNNAVLLQATVMDPFICFVLGIYIPQSIQYGIFH